LAERIEKERGDVKHLHPESKHYKIKSRELSNNLGEITCGEGRYDPDKKNAMLFKNGVAINFQVIFRPSEQQPKIERFSLCCAFPDQVRILYHSDPKHAKEGLQYHLELTTDGEDALWKEKVRYSIGKVQPIEILRFFFQLGRQESCLKVKGSSR
jgi:hypothetical protein